MANAKSNDSNVESMLERVLEKAMGSGPSPVSANALADRVKQIKETKRPEPSEKIEVGYAVISDYNGAGRKRVPMFMVMVHGSVVKPMHSMNGRATTGALFDKIKHREITVEQFTPYPQGHLLRGHGRIFDHEGYKAVDGTFYHPRYAPQGK